MIIATRQYGQLGNRLRLYAHVMAAAIEYDVTLYFPYLGEYAVYCPTVRNDRWCRYPTKVGHNCFDSKEIQPFTRSEQFSRWLLCKQVYLFARTLSHLRCTCFPAHVIRLKDGRYCDLHTSEIRKKAQSTRPLLVAGFGFSSDELLNKHAQRIREHFQIHPVHQKNVDLTMKPLRQSGTKIIGVHIRHGDYRTWQGGRYYYPVEEYAASMKELADRNHNSGTRFLVCGNAKVSALDFPGLDVSFSTGHLIEDLYSLPKTDLIIGPPSTFSGWAAFMGDVALLRMLRVENREGLIDPELLNASL